jgi:hypothetical protein
MATTPPTPAPAPAPTPTPTGAPAPAPKTWMPVTAGIFTIIAGVVDFLVGLIVGAIGHAAGVFAGIWGLGAFGVPHIVLGIIAVIGGIFAVQRKVWLMALVGAICALMWPLSLLGILSIIFVCLSQKEFK